MQSLAKNDIEHYTVNCIEKTKIKKEAGNGPFKKLGVTIAQLFRLRLPSCNPKFESQDRLLMT